jgi:hypothetical protein
MKDVNIPDYEDIYGLKEVELERVLKEKGFEGLPKANDLAKVFFYYETKTFNKELYKKLTLYEKSFVRSLEVFVEGKYEHMVLANRCLISGEKFKPYEILSDEGQPNIEETANGVYLSDMLKHLLKLEYDLEQKYNEEGDK